MRRNSPVLLSKKLVVAYLLCTFEYELELTLRRTLLVNSAGLEHAKSLIAGYKGGTIKDMNPELWNAKKIVDSTLHPGSETKWYI